tara:strand:+ start:526 stop:981 length:456 start_codon:yes stop_codon:yes gene_type:complete
MEHRRDNPDIAKPLLKPFKNVARLGDLTGPGLVSLDLVVAFGGKRFVDGRDVKLNELPDPGRFRRIAVDRRQIDLFCAIAGVDSGAATALTVATFAGFRMILSSHGFHLSEYCPGFAYLSFIDICARHPKQRKTAVRMVGRLFDRVVFTPP